MLVTSQDKKEIWVGSLVFLAGIILLVGVYWHAPSHDENKGKSYRINARFNRTDGLHTGDEVRMAGIPVGYVDSQVLDEHFGAKVTMVIESDLKLPTDSSASVETDGLFGSKYLELEPGGMEKNIPENGHIIYTQDSMIIQELLDKIIAMGRSVRGLDDEKESQADTPQPKPEAAPSTNPFL